MEHIVDPGYRLRDAVIVTHVTDVKLDLIVGQGNAHILLLLLVA